MIVLLVAAFAIEPWILWLRLEILESQLSAYSHSRKHSRRAADRAGAAARKATWIVIDHRRVFFVLLL